MRQLTLKMQAIMPVIFWLSLIITTLLMLIELASKQGGWPYWDKVQHAVLFASLSLIGFISFKHKFTWVYIGLAIYGALIEYLQGALTITRLASIGDWWADILGIVIAISLWLIVKKHRLKYSAASI